MDRTYANLVTFLHKPTSQLSVAAVQSLLAHYLANLQPSPTPLVAVLAYSTFTSANLSAVSAAFHSAVHLKKRHFDQNPSGLFTNSLGSRWSAWTGEVLKGLRGCEPLPHLACTTGLVLGLQDFKEDVPCASAHNDLVIAFAQCMDTYASDSPEMASAVLLASQGLPCVSDLKMKALPLSLVSQLINTHIAAVFHDGAFLLQKGTSAQRPASTPGVLLESRGMQSLGPVSKLAARALSLLMDARSSEGLRVAEGTLSSLQTIASRLRADWDRIDLATPSSSLGSQTQYTPEETRAVYSILKTLLFSFIMISRESLSSSLYAPTSSSSSKSANPTAVSLATLTLKTFFHLSFILSQFGGVTAGSKAFPQLQETFFLALDILSSQPAAAEEQIAEFCDSFIDTADIKVLERQQSNKAFTLCCIEHLVSSLSEKIIEERVLGLCFPHLHDSSHREIFESSHSAVLSILSSQASKLDSHPSSSTSQSPDSKPGSLPGVAQRFVPYYCDCLLENSAPNRLNTTQLRLAFTSLVRFSYIMGQRDESDVLVLYVLQQIKHLIHQLEPRSSSCSNSDGSASSTSPLSSTPSEIQLQRRHALILTLISALSALPLRILAPSLEDTKKLIISVDPDDSYSTSPSAGAAAPSELANLPETDASLRPREELVRELFDVLFDQVGYAEKEYVKDWWYANRDELLGQQVVQGTGDGEGGDYTSKEMRSRI